MKVYKATDKDMKCRGFQYEIGKTAEVDGDAKLCERGLHACEMPLDVLGYYAPGDGSRYFAAELEDVSDEMHSDDTKRVGKKLTLRAEIGIPGLVKAQVEHSVILTMPSKRQTAKRRTTPSARGAQHPPPARVAQHPPPARVAQHPPPA